jgi:ABC-2 type transport system permease protein
VTQSAMNSQDARAGSQSRATQSRGARFRNESISLYRQTGAITRKELAAYFGSPIALIFIALFLVAALGSFFWIESFFVRNIADIRPLFRWMPALMIFLVAALTMRQWSEEQRSGTMEVLLTLPVRRVALVLGKFLAVLTLIAVSLALTFFVPITVSLLGDLDWAPVFGGYLAALLMSSAYIAIGLFVSSRTDNQIVALIVTIVLCVLLYGAGTRVVTDLVSDSTSEILRAIGSGSRFESIERGVIDLRDLIYYLSLTVLFCLLNIVSLDAKRWSVGEHTAAYRRNAVLRIVLVAANLLALNAWLFPISALRLDLTEFKEYSLSPVTKDLIRGLQEPLLIRAYLSEQTHPLLKPLVPTIRDMLREYQIASGGKIISEVVDPRDNEELEAEANQIYGIQPVPFRVQGRYEDSVINSYFDILIRYGDQSVVLGFQDLIEIQQSGASSIDVRLRNLEYDLTRSIKKVVYGFQSIDAVFAGIEGSVNLTLLVTPNTLPSSLADVPGIVQDVAADLFAESGGKLSFAIVNPDDPSSTLTRQSLYDTYGLQPFAVSLFSADTYYLHLLLEIGGDTQVIYPSGNVSQADLRTEIESALKRAAPGFLKTVGIWTPSEDPVQDPYTGQAMSPISTWQTVRQYLAQNYTVKTVDLASGRVPGDVDVLVLIAPQGLDDKALFAVDQFLMRGGSVIAAAGSFALSPQQYGGITMMSLEGGLGDLLASYGVTVESSMVLDPQNEPFPVQVPRTVGGMQVVEMRQINYPYFVDIRSDGMDSSSPIVANLPAVTLQWASPLQVDESTGRDTVVLLHSTANAWKRSDVNVNPDMQTYPELGFPIEGEREVQTLAVSVRGSFDSYFADRPSPFEPGEALPEPPGVGTETESTDQGDSTVLGTVTSSPESSRLVVIGSAEFLDDTVLDISRSMSQDRYLNNLNLVQNAVDWAVEDEDLLSIRSRGTYARLLRPLEETQQIRWEVINYVVALLGLIGVGVVWYTRRQNEEPRFLVDESTEQGGAQ